MLHGSSASKDSVDSLKKLLDTLREETMRRIDEQQDRTSARLAEVDKSMADVSNRLSTHTTTVSIKYDLELHKTDVRSEIDSLAGKAPDPLIRHGLKSAALDTVESHFAKLSKGMTSAVTKGREGPLTEEQITLSPQSSKFLPGPGSGDVLYEPEISEEGRATILSGSKGQILPKKHQLSDKFLVETSQLSVDVFFGKISLATQIWQTRTTIHDSLHPYSRAQIEMRTEFRFHPASWLIKYGFAVGVVGRIARMHERPKLSLEPYRAVPDDALVFEFAYGGNLDGLKALFKRGSASAYDTDSRGWTPLAWAAYSMGMPTVKWLLEHGSDKDTRVRSHRDKEQTNE